MTCGIYRISTPLNGRCYIGSSQDIRKRWNAHKSSLRKGTHHSIKLQRSWNKYGESSFVWEILEECEMDSLLDREQFWIDSTQPAYNTALFAGSPMRGRTISQETRALLSKIHTGNKYNLGRVHTQTQRDKTSAQFKGIPKTPEHRAKIGLAQRGKTISLEAIEKAKETKRRRRQPSIDFVAVLLCAGDPVPCKTVLVAGLAAGFTRWAIESAKRELGAITVKVGNVYYWQLEQPEIEKKEAA